MTPLPGAPNPLVGTWKLVSFEFEAEGSNEQLDVYDEHPVGFIIFTADWRVLALVTASERADDETARALFDRMMAYSGRTGSESTAVSSPSLTARGIRLGSAPSRRTSSR